MRTVGVEEEFLLVDAATSRVGPFAGELLAAVEQIGEEPVVESELKQEQAELASNPHTDLDALRVDLIERRHKIQSAAGKIGLRVAVVGTSPTPVDPTTTPRHRYETMTREFGLVGREQLTCGTHVHVSVESRAEGVEVLNRIRPWLPVLTAISANSPFWDGDETGYASYRSITWGRWPTAGPYEIFDGIAGYDRTVDQLIASGTILDNGMIYFDARLSARYPTVEIRVADACTSVDDAVLIAALSRALVDQSVADAQAGIPPVPASVALLRVAAWRAARSGLSDNLIDIREGCPVAAWALVNKLVEWTSPALDRHGSTRHVVDLLDELRARGTGAELQRRRWIVDQDPSAVLEDIIRRSATS